MIIDSISNNEQESRKEWILAIFKSAGNYNSNITYFQFWLQDNRPIELWSNEVIQQKLTYIHNNPVATGLVNEPWHWKYSSAIDYAGGKGLLDLMMI